MLSATVVQQVRQLVDQTFRAMRVPPDTGMEETILIRNGFYCGRRFAVAGAHAIWFCEENQLKFYGDDGQLLCVIDRIEQHLGSTAPFSAQAA